MQNVIYLDVFFIVVVLLVVFSLARWQSKNIRSIQCLKKHAIYSHIVQSTARLFFIVMFILLIMAGLTAWRLMSIFIEVNCYGVSAWALTAIWFFIVLVYAGLALYYKIMLIYFQGNFAHDQQ